MDPQTQREILRFIARSYNFQRKVEMFMTKTEQALSDLQQAIADEQSVDTQFFTLVEEVAKELRTLLNTNPHLDATVSSAISKQTSVLQEATAAVKKVMAELQDANTPLTLTALSPNTAAVNNEEMTITVTGTGFDAGSVVELNAVALKTTFVNSTTLTAVIPAGTFVAAGEDEVLVTDSEGNETDPLPITVS